MDPIAINLERASEQNRAQLGDDVVKTLALQTKSNGRGLEAAMAQNAQRELFSEALMAAAKAHFAEIKTVTSK